MFLSGVLRLVRVEGISEVSSPFVTLQRARVEKADKQKDGLFSF